MKTLFNSILIVSIVVVIWLSVCYPKLLATNDFLQHFINHELLNILAVIMTVTIASAANMHLALNRAEEMAQTNGLFDGARKEINGDAILLIVLFIVTIAVLILRSVFIDTEWLVSIFNGAGIIILIANVMALVDITTSVFELHPLLKNKETDLENH